ncbi:hypothetical protein LSH36_17g03062, partial [Paralvinella palmiformis]
TLFGYFVEQHRRTITHAHARARAHTHLNRQGSVLLTTMHQMESLQLSNHGTTPWYTNILDVTRHLILYETTRKPNKTEDPGRVR